MFIPLPILLSHSLRMGGNRHKYLHFHLADGRDTPVVGDRRMDMEGVGGTCPGMGVLTPQG